MFFIGYLIYGNVNKTEQRLEDTESRLIQTESSMADRNIQLESIVSKFESHQIKLEQTMEEISKIQNTATAQLRNDFYGELKKINDASNTTLAEIAETDKAARDQLLQSTRVQITGLEASFSEQLLTSMEQFKAAQN